jgi:nitrite reductase (NADH) large subunit
MAKIVILGNSAAGFSCCDTLVKSSQDNEITLISQENYPAYRKTLLIDYLADKVKVDELFLCTQDYYEKNRIKFLKNSKVVRLDTKKKLVILKDNTKINYDYLVIATGQKVIIPDIPGNNKDGIFAVNTLEDIEKIKLRLMLLDVVCIVGEEKRILSLLEVIATRNKEIKIICKSSPESFIPQEKIEWISEAALTEIIGEGSELKAVKLSNGKAIGVSLVLFAGDYQPSTDFLKESGINIYKDYILVNQNLKTNFPEIFACGSVCKIENNLREQKSWEEASNEGVLVAHNLIAILERGKSICQPMS